MRRVGALMAVCRPGRLRRRRAGFAVPPKLSYNGSTLSGLLSARRSHWTPAASGTVDQYRVSPSLPSGLSIDERRRVISVADEASGPATYVW